MSPLVTFIVSFAATIIALGLFTTSQPTAPTTTPNRPIAPAVTSTTAATHTAATAPKISPTNSHNPAPRATTTDAIVSIPELHVTAPDKVVANQPFTISWSVTGPAGLTGSGTTLHTVNTASKQDTNSNLNSSSESNQQYGAFTVPTTWSTELTFGGAPGTVQVDITATVNNQTLVAHHSIPLIN